MGAPSFRWDTMFHKFLRRSPSSRSAVAAPDIELDELVEEEKAPHVELRCFFPTRLGDVLQGRYQVMAKLGYGGRSTVWLAKDLHRWVWQKTRYVAIKVTVAGDLAGDKIDDTELQALQEITKINPEHPGYDHILTLWDTFYVSSPAGQHLCLVFEPLREPIRMIKQCFEGDVMPVQLIKGITPLVLQALDYLHSECHIIHCDISESNLLFRFSQKAGHKVLQEHSQVERTDPLPVKRLVDRTIYLSHNSFGTLAGNIGGCVLTDFDTSVRGGEGEEWNHDIQPLGMTAPEVLLRAKWNYSADIWNFGAMLCGLIEGKPIFDDAEREHWKDFSEPLSFARMIAFLGPPPAALLERAERLEEFYDEGRVFRYPELMPMCCSFDTFFTRVDGEEKQMVIALVRRMLRWLPEERDTAKELLGDPWLQEILQKVQE